MSGDLIGRSGRLQYKLWACWCVVVSLTLDPKRTCAAESADASCFLQTLRAHALKTRSQAPSTADRQVHVKPRPMELLSFDWCDASGETSFWSRPDLHTQPNATHLLQGGTTSGRSLVAGGFKDVLLMVSRAHAHAILHIHRAYQPYFRGVVFIHSFVSEAEQRNLTKEGVDFGLCECPRSPTTQDDLTTYDVSYLCMAQILSAKFGASDGSDTETRGVLSVQSDFWLAPTFGEGLDLDSLLIPAATGGCNDGHWSTEDRKRSDALMKLHDEFGDSLPSSTHCNCHAWVDFYYVPKGALSVWTRAALTIGRSSLNVENPLFNEHAIPLTFQVARELGNCAGNHGCTQRMVNCFGGCCTNANLGDIRGHSCGHRLNWLDTALKLEFSQVWKEAKGI